ncbi:hypothetical protein NM688_g8853 [Phlebia brevispora]|uniref:Uncharacterized protein n=1 Tax=Phlebia brevispora TaxID=194682 RepID=A0ACC1RM79_9APHY|nr:hypothetical protein NM688_g8853 [Phlebia brevispora]
MFELAATHRYKQNNKMLLWYGSDPDGARLDRLPVGGHRKEIILAIPVYRVEEDSKTIDLLLRCCSPMNRPHLLRNNTVSALYITGRKYTAEIVKQHSLADFLWLASKDGLCFRASAIAYHSGLQDVLLQAARQSMDMSLRGVTDGNPSQWGLASASSVKGLPSFHKYWQQVVVTGFLGQPMLYV